MGTPPTRHHSDSYRIDEVEVRIRIKDGKITAESRTGPKAGAITLDAADMFVELALEGAGSDKAEATLTGTELANFRSIIDATLSTLTENDDDPALARDAIYSGYLPLRRVGDEIGLVFDEEILRELNLVTDDGEIPGGNRQVQCTVIGNGTAIVELAGDQ